MKHICIVSGDHLWLNPRVVKEADALSAAGFQVTVIGPTLTEFDQARDETILATRSWRRIAAPNLLAPDQRGPKRFLTRLSRRAQMIAVRRLGLQLPGALGYGVGETITAAERVTADIYSCHVEVGMLAFRRLSRLGRRCVVDLEDWHSRDLGAAAQRERPNRLIVGLERQVLNQAEFTTTTSGALADALVAAYGGSRPLVVFNAFEKSGDVRPAVFADRRSVERPSLHWYSLNVGRGRGLELLFDAVNRLDLDFELHIRGEGPQSYKDELLARLKLENAGRVFFHATTDPAVLPLRIAEHDIGFAMELRTPPSRDLTITNKVFQFLQCGCAVIASRTSGQEEAAALFPEAIFLSEPEPAALAATLSQLIRTPGALTAARAAARKAGDGAASWEEASRVLVRRYIEAVGAPG